MTCRMFDSMPAHPGHLQACNRCGIRKACKAIGQPEKTIGQMLADLKMPEDERFKRKPGVHWSQTEAGKERLAQARINSHISRRANEAAKKAAQIGVDA